MSRERLIFPNKPEELCWEGYKKLFPISASSAEIEKINIKHNIEAIKLKIYAMVAATPKDVCNENDDPIDYVVNKFIHLINDYKFNVEKQHQLFLIDTYQESKENGPDDAGRGTQDPDVQKEWEPYVWFSSMCPSTEYECEHEIREYENTANFLMHELMMYVAATPTNVYEQKDKYSNESFDEVRFRVREILDEEDGIEYEWWHALSWKFAKDNFNDKSYNSF